MCLFFFFFSVAGFRCYVALTNTRTAREAFEINDADSPNPWILYAVLFFAMYIFHVSKKQIEQARGAAGTSKNAAAPSTVLNSGVHGTGSVPSSRRSSTE